MKIIVIGAGFGGLSAASYLAKAGHDVTVLEKNGYPGGRANSVVQDGFRFELGPSWYLMPDVFDEFFADFGHKTSDFYELKKLVPSYRVYGRDSEFTARPRPAASMYFERREVGAGPRLARFLDEAKREYEFARRKILALSGLSKVEFMKAAAGYFAANPALLGPYHNRVAGVVRDELLQQVLEFMTVFLGGSPQTIPALYSVMAHVDFGQGIWYPKGGFTEVAKAVEAVAKEQGVKITYDTPVRKIITKQGRVSGIKTAGKMYQADAVVANADYHFVDTQLTPDTFRVFAKKQWAKKQLSPSAIMATVGVKKRLNLEHHTLFFDTDWQGNFDDVFKRHRLNPRPLFSVNAPSVNDASVAPKGCENLVLLIPVSNQIKISTQQAEKIVDQAIVRIEQKTGQTFADKIVTKDIYTPDFFETTYNAARGNAFGLSHTLGQTGPLRPPVRSPKLPNLYFTGQYTNPGTGVPLVLLSGKVVASNFDN